MSEEQLDAFSDPQHLATEEIEEITEAVFYVDTKGMQVLTIESAIKGMYVSPLKPGTYKVTIELTDI